MSKHHVTTTINGEPAEFLCDAQQTMLDVLRDQLEPHRQQGRLQLGRLRRLHVMLDGAPRLLVPGARRSRPRATRSRPSKASPRAQAAPAAAEIPRARGAAVRLLHAGLADRGQGAARAQSGPDRARDPLLDRRQSLPLHRLRQDRARRARCRRRHAAGLTPSRLSPLTLREPAARRRCRRLRAFQKSCSDCISVPAWPGKQNDLRAFSLGAVDAEGHHGKGRQVVSELLQPRG